MGGRDVGIGMVKGKGVRDGGLTFMAVEGSADVGMGTAQGKGVRDGGLTYGIEVSPLCACVRGRCAVKRPANRGLDESPGWVVRWSRHREMS